jgi:hypothetical protein
MRIRIRIQQHKLMRIRIRNPENLKNKNPISRYVLTWAYPMVQPLSCRSNLAGQYLSILLLLWVSHNESLKKMNLCSPMRATKSFCDLTMGIFFQLEKVPQTYASLACPEYCTAAVQQLSPSAKISCLIIFHFYYFSCH